MKWADYLISAVRYDTSSKNRIISYFKIHTDTGDSVGESRTWTKDELLDALVHGKSFVTIKKKDNGKWMKVSEVSVTSNKEVFIRTDFRNIPEDFLEDISEF